MVNIDEHKNQMGHEHSKPFGFTVQVSVMFVCDEVLWPSQPNGVMSSMVSLPNHTFTGQA